MPTDIRIVIYLAASFNLIVVDSSGFLEHPDVTPSKPSQCVWYGECGYGWDNDKLNCPATGDNRYAPKLTDPDALQTLRQYCPELYNGDNDTRTCCSGDQLRTFKSSVSDLKQLLSNCSACYYNVLNFICHMSCSPHQAMFVWYTNGIDGISEIDVIGTNKFAGGIYDSCKDVKVPGTDIQSMTMLCVRPVSECLPNVWLNFMGITRNMYPRFTVNYIATDKPWTAPDGSILQPLSVDTKRCNETVSGSTEQIGSSKCACYDCALLEACPPLPTPTSSTRQHFLDATFGAGNYVAIELVISRLDSLDPVSHFYPPPSTDSMYFTSIFDKDFLIQVLSLQSAVSNLTVDDVDPRKTVILDDVCITKDGVCVIYSALQWYQNNATTINSITMDTYGIFVMADYLDHFLTCTRAVYSSFFLAMDDVFKTPCLSAFGNRTFPYIVLQGYDQTEYENATSFVITYVLRDSKSGPVKAWLTKFVNFMKAFNNPNMSVTYTIRPQVFEDPGYVIISADKAEGEEGHCVWYDHCGDGWNGGALNCPATIETRNPPLLTDPNGLRILKTYCPQLYTGDESTRTCCSPSQLQAMEEKLALPDQLLSRCPTCFKNFLSQICQMTCSPKQSQFLYANMSALCPSGLSSPCPGGGIPSVTYIMTPKYADDLYTSCKDVQNPNTNDKAMSLLCGRKTEECSPAIWLSYMGSIGNGKAPFPILYLFTNKTWTDPNNEIHVPLNVTNLRCNLTYENLSDRCSCPDYHSNSATMPPLSLPAKPYAILAIYLLYNLV